MKPRNGLVFSSVAELKKNLNPSLSYVLLEKEVATSDVQCFSEIVQVLSSHKTRDLEWQIYRDEATKKTLLLIGMKDEHTEMITEEILSAGLPKNVNYSLYRSCAREQNDKEITGLS